MPRIEKPEAPRCYQVDIIESERGWGRSVLDSLYFDNEPEAMEYVRTYNAKLPTGPAPDYYIIAVYVGESLCTLKN